jgi:long-subunit acyl-CoA synthetase (AMP-forming)
LGVREAGVECGDPEALSGGNRKEWVAACLAVLSAGAEVMPVDAQLGEEALGHV